MYLFIKCSSFCAQRCIRGNQYYQSN